MRSVYLDSNCLILMIESGISFDRPLQMAASGIWRLVASELILAEVLVRPIRDRDARLKALYEGFLSESDLIDLMPVTREILRATTAVRATLGNKTPDAVHVATATAAGCDLFISSDRKLRLPPGMTRIGVEDADNPERWP